MSAHLDDIIELLGRRGAHGYQELVDLAHEAPDAIPDMVVAGAARLERGSTGIDAVLELVRESDLGLIAEAAVDALRAGMDPEDSQAAHLVAQLSLQAPSELRSHLADLWQLHPNSRSYYAEWPWRAAQEPGDLDLLLAHLGDSDQDLRKRVWRGLLESRTAQGWDAAVAAIGSVVADDRGADGSLHLVGIERAAEGTRRLAQPEVCHIEFPPGFLKPPQWSSVCGRLEYPTW